MKLKHVDVSNHGTIIKQRDPWTWSPNGAFGPWPLCASRGPKGPRKPCRAFFESLSRARRSQEEARRPRRSQEEPGGPGGGQESQEEPRRSQEQPFFFCFDFFGGRAPMVVLFATWLL